MPAWRLFYKSIAHHRVENQTVSSQAPAHLSGAVHEGLPIRLQSFSYHTTLLPIRRRQVTIPSAYPASRYV